MSIQSIQINISKWKATSEQVSGNIYVRTEDTAFRREVKVLIDEINTNSVGKRLLEKISSYITPIFVVSANENSCDALHAEIYTRAKLFPPIQVSLSLSENKCCYSTKGEAISSPRDVIFFHELVHSYHMLTRKNYQDRVCDPIVWSNAEEYKTVIGFPSTQNKTTAKITENAYREAKGLPARYSTATTTTTDLLTPVLLSRIKLLGGRYEDRKKADPHNLSPPPIELCVHEDLGSKCSNLTLLVVVLDGVEIDKFLLGTRPDTKKRDLYYIPPRYILESEDAKQAAREKAPSLQGRQFKIKKFDSALISEHEFNLITE